MDDCIFDDNACDICESDFYRLIDFLIMDMRKLELKVVRLRYLLSGFLPKPERDALRQGLLSDLSGNYYDEAACLKYASKHCGGQGPMGSAAFDGCMLKVSEGGEIVDI